MIKSELTKDCYCQWQKAKKEKDFESARYLKDLYVILIKGQIIILGQPIFDQ